MKMHFSLLKVQVLPLISGQVTFFGLPSLYTMVTFLSFRQPVSFVAITSQHSLTVVMFGLRYLPRVRPIAKELIRMSVNFHISISNILKYSIKGVIA